MTGLSLALGLIAAIAIVAAGAAAVRARRAEAACRASEEKCLQLVDQESVTEAARRAADQEARHAQAMDAVGQSAGDVAHDLNDLLAAITGRTELLLASLDESHPARQDAYEIQRAALSAARITRPLRALGATRTATEVIDVNAVTSRTADALREMLGGGIDVSLALDPGVLHVTAVASRVEEIILNLAMNARAAMPRGGRLTLSTARYTRHEPDVSAGPSGDYVRLVVADTGSGVSEDASAVGLAKVSDIVKQAGGQIHVESAHGLGTTVTIDLPATPELPASSPAAPLSNAIVASVLVVEDEPRVRELVKLVLTRGGHDVVAVAGPHEALAVLKRQRNIELLLLDVIMPDMSGYDLAVQARAIVPGVRVVFMSGFARDLARHPPGDAFLPKPFKVESLSEVVQQALRAS